MDLRCSSPPGSDAAESPSLLMFARVFDRSMMINNLVCKAIHDHIEPYQILYSGKVSHTDPH